MSCHTICCLLAVKEWLLFLSGPEADSQNVAGRPKVMLSFT